MGLNVLSENKKEKKELAEEKRKEEGEKKVKGRQVKVKMNSGVCL